MAPDRENDGSLISHGQLAERYRAVLEKSQNLTFDGQTPQTAWEFHMQLARDPEFAESRELFEHAARGAYIRLQLENDENFAGLSGWSALGFRIFIDQRMRKIDDENRAWLAVKVDEQGWFTVSRFGELADVAAFTIVRHSDSDPHWQASMLELLTPLAAEGETSAQGLAMLHDRVATNFGRVQRYGTRGRCVDAGVWEPDALEERDDIDHLRATVGLVPLANFVETKSRDCEAGDDRLPD